MSVVHGVYLCCCCCFQEKKFSGAVIEVWSQLGGNLKGYVLQAAVTRLCFCVSCDELLSLEHILLFCLDLIDIRKKVF